ncbi:hypothetical protein GCM10022226_71160 [Sphaerisporangium flaviroseum]|uniref:Mycothiol-dependent maleylpyruvate isomerase metal-binding domain-containing protein n=1 Tax=Sphaerisporangium flaviroseum TaxID=509199 RepID=A0ABP7J9Z0_9ACTN
MSDDTETVPTPLPHGDLPTPVAAVMCALDAAVHAWDIAIATGQPSPLDDELAGHLLAAAQGIVEPLRQWGAYAPVVEAEAADGPTSTPVRRRPAPLPRPRPALTIDIHDAHMTLAIAIIGWRRLVR